MNEQNNGNYDVQGEKDLLERLQNAILSYETEEAKKIAKEIVERKVNPLKVMSSAVANVARQVGDKFESGQIFLPHLVIAGDIMSEVSTILESSLTVAESEKLAKKIVVIGTVQGDIHSIGKSIVAMLMRANGLKVHDLGVDVRSTAFVEKGEELGADIIAMSCLLTTTMPYQRQVIEELQHRDLRNNFKIMVGGGPVTQEWADEIGADGYGKDAVEAVKVAKSMLGIS